MSANANQSIRPEREPDYLIDRDGDAWERKGEDSYGRYQARMSRSGIEAAWGPVVAVWR